MATDKIQFYINHHPCTVTGAESVLPLAEFLRKRKGFVGTKIVCAEGDCGACTILLRRGSSDKYEPVNSCIFPVFLLNGAHLITVEGVAQGEELHPVQTAMMSCHGSQCGFCTPGFICSMTGMVENHREKQSSLTRKEVQNHLTGNLCRCTGYEPIIQAGMSLDLKQTPSLKQQYHLPAREQQLKAAARSEVLVRTERYEVYLPITLKQACQYKSEHSDVKIVAGATDLGVLVNKGKYNFTRVMSLYQISELQQVQEMGSHLEVGAQVSLSNFEKAVAKVMPELRDLMQIFASPQIKNAGTLIGNLVNGSPIGDTLPYLMMAGATLSAQSVNGAREIPLTSFYQGYKKLDLKFDEIITAVKIPVLKEFQHRKAYKVSLRRDLDISAVTLAGAVKLKEGKILELRLALGGVGPTVLRVSQLEAQMSGRPWQRSSLEHLQQEIAKTISPLSDVRGSREFRFQVVHNLLEKFYDESGGL